MPTETLVLSPHGHVEHDLALVDDGEAVLAHVEPGHRRRARGLAGPDALHAPRRGRPTSPPSTRSWARRPAGGSSRGPSLAAYDGELAGVAAWEALRVEAQRPRLGVDTDERTIPNETRWLGTAVHLAKGCYRGQETVARVANLGRPPRRLALLHLDGSDSELPATGDARAAGRPRGRPARHGVRHHELGPVALALVKRQVPDDADLSSAASPRA